MRKKIIGAISGMLIIVTALVFGIAQNNRASITKIDFPIMGGHLPHDVQYNLDSNINFKIEKIKPDKKEAEDKIYKLYKTPKNKKQKTDKLKKIFNLSNSKKIDMGEVISFYNDECSLDINENGTFQYHKKKRNDSKPIHLSDDKCIEIAKNFLYDNELLPSDFFENGVAYVTKTAVNDPNDSTIVGKDVYFNRKVNNKLVKGVSRIIVSVDYNGEIEAVYSLYRDIEEKDITVKIKDFEIAFNDLKNQKGMIRMNSDAKAVNIKEVDLTYWEDSTPYSKQTHIQPVYHFIGECTDLEGNQDIFEAFIAAVPDELLEIKEDKKDTKPLQEKPVQFHIKPKGIKESK